MLRSGNYRMSSSIGFESFMHELAYIPLLSQHLYHLRVYMLTQEWYHIYSPVLLWDDVIIMVYVYVIGWSTVVFGINSTSNAVRKRKIA